MAKAGLDGKLADMVELVYVDAPNPASGKIPRDVAPFFQASKAVEVTTRATSLACKQLWQLRQQHYYVMT